MKNRLYTIPNIITCLNLFAGCLSIIYSFKGDFLWSFLFIIIASVLDFSDGLAARLFKAYSLIGKELDSLADMISFGAAPGFILYNYLCVFYPNVSYDKYLVFIVVGFSALRLAKFNTDQRQTEEFIGLPTPANALFFSSLIYMLSAERITLDNRISENPYIIYLLTIFFSFLLVSEIRMFSFKFTDLSFKKNIVKYLFASLSVIIIIVLDIAAIPLIIILYILTSVVINICGCR